MIIKEELLSWASVAVGNSLHDLSEGEREAEGGKDRERGKLWTRKRERERVLGQETVSTCVTQEKKNSANEGQ